MAAVAAIFDFRSRSKTIGFQNFMKPIIPENFATIGPGYLKLSLGNENGGRKKKKNSDET